MKAAWILILALVAAVAGAQDVPEPNDTVDKATPLALGAEVRFTLDPKGDVDVFALTSARAGVLRVELLEVPKVHRPVLHWLGADGKLLRKEADIAVTAGQSLFLRVGSQRTRSADKASKAPIRLKVTWVAQPDAYEPNDSVATAQRIELGKPVKFVLLPRLDRDVFRVDAPGAGALIAKLERHSVHSPGIRWLDAKGKHLEAYGSSARAIAAGPLYVEVRSNRIGVYEKASTQPLTLTVSFVVEPFGGEPNDTVGSARKVKLDTPVRFALLPRFDSDVFRVTAPRAGVLEAQVTQDTKTHRLNLAWRDAKGRRVRGNYPRMRVASGQVVFLEVTSANLPGYAVGSANALTLRLRMLDDAAPGEPDDDPKTPRAIALDTPVKLAIFPARDRDVFRVEAPAAGVLKVATSGAPKGVRPRVIWLKAKGRPSGPELRVWTAGPVLFAVSSSSGISPDAFTLRVTHSGVTTKEEPNDTVAQATKIALDTPVEFALTPTDDKDVFVIRSGKAGVLEVVFEHVPKGHRPALRWRDASGAVIRRGEPTLRVAAGASAFLEVTSEVSSPEPLKMRVRLLSEPAGPEPNDTPEEALVLEVGKPRTFALFPRLDRDVFRIDAPGPGQVRVEIRQPGSDHEPYVRWLDAAGKALRHGHADLRVRAKGPVFAEVRSNRHERKEKSSPKPLTIVARFSTDADVHEPNDTREQARPLAPGPLTLRLFPVRDEDWFRILPPRDGVLTLALVSGPRDFTPYVDWFDERGRRIARGLKPRWVPGGEPVYVMIASASRGWRRAEVPGELKFELRLTSTQDPFEPNDSVKAATALTQDSGVSGELVKGDEDWFRFAVPRSGRYRLTLGGDAGVRVDVTGREGKAVAPSPATEEVELRGGQVLLIRLRLAKGTTAAARYQLRVVGIGGDPGQPPGRYPRQAPAPRGLDLKSAFGEGR